ncbi:MAG TPA: hypothetical protein VHV30_06570 [Polyangiaceae bacterium]|nr:hypothetical protein [Polyangiaceae bacterium]
MTCRLLLFLLLAPGAVACGTSLDLGSNDAGIPYDADCAPGVYTGMLQCTVAPSSPVAFSTSAPMTLLLAPAGARTLALPPDASLVTDNSGTTSVTALVGQLDCATRQFVGHDGPVAFTSTTFRGTISGTGAFTATYDPDASPPQLVNGVLDSSPTLGSNCTWTATHQP